MKKRKTLGLGFPFLFVPFSQIAEELCEQAAALIRHDVFGHFALMVEALVVQQSIQRIDAACLAIARAVDDMRNARLQNGAGAHRARL